MGISVHKAEATLQTFFNTLLNPRLFPSVVFLNSKSVISGGEKRRVCSIINTAHAMDPFGA
jgi:hypothetical protein